MKLSTPTNTSKPRSVAKLERALAGLQKHFDLHPKDDMTARRIVNVKKKINGGK